MISIIKGKARKGFTLIELMIVVAIIGILAAVAIPKFADLINKSKEGATKGSLGAIRSALTVYYGDAEGTYPIDKLSGSLTPRYLADIPPAKVPPTGESADVTAIASSTETTNTIGWAYVNVSGTSSWGTILVNGNKTDSKGLPWSGY